ncbi:MAG: hypothetical protein HY302_02200 [Opitutae bacterium]|nr:hypothetical protein [Opitutae bacterium]
MSSSQEVIRTSEKKRRRIPISPGLVRFLFRASHIVIPLVGVLFVVGHLAFHWILTWELLVLIAATLVPFVLPLLGFYVGKIGVVEMTDRGIFEDVEAECAGITAINETPQDPIVEGDLIPALVPPLAAPARDQPHLGTRLSLDPDFNSLTRDEQKVIRTHWKHQREYLQGKLGIWGFVVAAGSPDDRSFFRGSSSLIRRGLVKRDARGLVFLTDYGIGFGDRNSDLLDQGGNVWTRFAPA